MSEPINVIRQMMAEAKLFEAQIEAERILSVDPSLKKDVLPLYLEILIQQNKTVSETLKFEVAEILFATNLDDAESLLKSIKGSAQTKNFNKIQNLKIQIAEKKGRMDELYSLLSEYQIFLYESQIPFYPAIVQTYVEKYFKDDFKLKLQKLSLMMLLGDSDSAEKLIQELILSCVERSSPKGTKGKIQSLYEIMKVQKERGYLEMYLNFCHLFLEGVTDKKDYKKLVELVVYIDDIKFQAQILMLMHKLNLEDVAQDYAEEIKINSAYSYVYFDKFFPDLKRYLFISKKLKKPEIKKETFAIDLTLESPVEASSTIPQQIADHSPEDETQFMSILKYEDYSANELIEVAVSFLESEFPKAALKASEKALSKIEINNDQLFLKASYLKLTALIRLSDYRAALDTALLALEKAQHKDDILSFLYVQAEVYLLLGQKTQAKNIYKKILTVDAKYRLAKEKFEKLNEV